MRAQGVLPNAIRVDGGFPTSASPVHHREEYRWTGRVGCVKLRKRTIGQLLDEHQREIAGVRIRVVLTKGDFEVSAAPMRPLDASGQQSRVGEGEYEDEGFGKFEELGEGEESRTDEERGKKLWQLFLKMLSLGMDRHALAIADGYRIKPQVCVCDDVCCTCFNYSSFLHNMKLHEHKNLLLREFTKLLAAQRCEESVHFLTSPTKESSSKTDVIVDEELELDEGQQSMDWKGKEVVEIYQEEGSIRSDLMKGETVGIWKSDVGAEDFLWDEDRRVEGGRREWTPESLERRLSESSSFCKKYPSHADSKDAVSSRPKSTKCECRQKGQIDFDPSEEIMTDLVHSTSGIGTNRSDDEIEGELKSSCWNVFERFLGESKREKELLFSDTKKVIAPSPTTSHRSTGPSRLDDSPPYETQRNSVHKRVREFDPDSYKTLVKGEARKLNEIPEPERKLGEDNRISRPPWKI